MSIKRAQDLLDAQLATVAGLPQLQLENTRAAVGTSFCRATINPATTNVLNAGFNARTEKLGLYTVDTYCPQDYGAGDAHVIADAIVDAFPVGLQLTDGTITVTIKVASVMTAMAFDKFYGVPVVVQWSVYG